jgi:hypothetical protein
VYRISAGPATPDFSVTVSPDNPNLAPGSSVYLPVRIRRRVGISGDIALTARNLPPGVTASPTVIPPDQNQAFLILTAAPDAKPGTFGKIAVEASTQLDGKTITRPATPYEVFLINNQQQFRPSENLVVTVGPDTGWRVSVVPEAMTMSPSGGPVKVTVKLDRRGNEGDIPFAIVGVPQGVQSQGSLLFKRGTSEMTFTMTPTNGGVFAARNGSAPPSASRFLLAVVNGREGEAMQMCSPAVAVAVQPAAGK